MLDLSSYSNAELAKILKAIPDEILRRELEEKARALKEIEALAAKNGYTLDELMRLPRGKAGQPKKPSRFVIVLRKDRCGLGEDVRLLGYLRPLAKGPRKTISLFKVNW